MQLRRFQELTAHARKEGCETRAAYIYVHTEWSTGRRQRLLYVAQQHGCKSRTLGTQGANTFQRASAVKFDASSPIAPDSLILELDAGRYARAEGSKRIKSLLSSPSRHGGLWNSCPSSQIHRSEMICPRRRSVPLGIVRTKYPEEKENTSLPK
jgi:hypothetical protein